MNLLFTSLFRFHGEEGIVAFAANLLPSANEGLSLHLELDAVPSVGVYLSPDEARLLRNFVLQLFPLDREHVQCRCDAPDDGCELKFEGADGALRIKLDNRAAPVREGLAVTMTFGDSSARQVFVGRHAVYGIRSLLVALFPVQLRRNAEP